MNFNPIRNNPTPFNPFMNNAKQWPNTIQNFCGVNTTKFSKYIWPYFDVIRDRVNEIILKGTYIFLLLEINNQSSPNSEFIAEEYEI